MKWIMVAALACTATLAAAQDKPDTPKPKAEKAKLICQTSGETGSRLGSRRECHTAAEWDRIRTETGEEVRRAFSPR